MLATFVLGEKLSDYAHKITHRELALWRRHFLYLYSRGKYILRRSSMNYVPIPGFMYCGSSGPTSYSLRSYRHLTLFPTYKVGIYYSYVPLAKIKSILLNTLFPSAGTYHAKLRSLSLLIPKWTSRSKKVCIERLRILYG